MLEVGGNIGACSMEVLLRTDARLIIFEPSFTNLYYLTRTLQAAHRHSPHLDLAHRVVVFPIGLGNESSSTASSSQTLLTQVIPSWSAEESLAPRRPPAGGTRTGHKASSPSTLLMS